MLSSKCVCLELIVNAIFLTKMISRIMGYNNKGNNEAKTESQMCAASEYVITWRDSVGGVIAQKKNRSDTLTAVRKSHVLS